VTRQHQISMEARPKDSQGADMGQQNYQGATSALCCAVMSACQAQLTWWLPRRSSGDTERSTACGFGLRLCFFLPGVPVSMASMPASAAISLQTACTRPPCYAHSSSTDPSMLLTSCKPVKSLLHTAVSISVLNICRRLVGCNRPHADESPAQKGSPWCRHSSRPGEQRTAAAGDCAAAATLAAWQSPPIRRHLHRPRRRCRPTPPVCKCTCQAVKLRRVISIARMNTYVTLRAAGVRCLCMRCRKLMPPLHRC
jgi:hypothetical protein